MRNPLAAVAAFLHASQRALPVLTHVGAGLAGGLLAILAAFLLTGAGNDEQGAVRQLAPLANRLSALERSVGGQSQVPDLRNRLDALARSTDVLDAANSKQAAELKALEERLGNAGAVAPELAERLAKLESAVTALTVAGAGETSEAVRSGLDRFERQVAGAKADATVMSSSCGQRKAASTASRLISNGG
jgi:hypothetical protein